MKLTLYFNLLFLVFTFHTANAQSSGWTMQIDSLLNVPVNKPFNGIVLLTQNGEIIYSKVCGYSDFEESVPLKINDQFVIGSISKQFTAAIVLQEYDKGRLDMQVPIKKYLPYLSECWSDTVTTHHLLSHTHGIIAFDKPTLFPVGTQCNYSNIGYELLARIAEKTSGKSFIELSTELFQECGMNNTYHPDLKKYRNLVKGYIENDKGKLEYTEETFSQYPTSPAFEGISIYPAAGTFISTPADLALWNKYLGEGKLLKENTFRLMTAKQENAIRKHSIFGHIEYGYGITVDDNNSLIQWGQTGYAPGFVSMNFYYPQNKVGVIVLENVNYDIYEIKKTFYYHTQILDIVRNELNKTN